MLTSIVKVMRVGHGNCNISVSPWRSNLVASNKDGSLLFVAISDEIHIFGISHPHYIPGNKPLHVWKYQYQDDSAVGYINPSAVSLFELLYDHLHF